MVDTKERVPVNAQPTTFLLVSEEAEPRAEYADGYTRHRCLKLKAKN